MRRWLVAALVVPPLAAALAAPRRADAEPHRLLVLQSEGRADAATRSKIDAAITRLAAAAEPGTSPGELTFGDAATAVGCRPDAPSCKDDVIGMLAVDEIVITTVTPKPGGLEIAVQRIARGGAARDAKMLLPTGAPPDKLDGLAPLFGDRLVARGPATLGPPTAPPGTAGARTAAGASTAADPSSSPGAPGTARASGAAGVGAVGSGAAGPAGPASGGGSISQPGAQPGPESPPAIPAPSAIVPPPRAVPETTAEPTPAVDQPSSRDRKLELGGMIGGGAAVVLGVALWNAASSTQNEIDAAPTRTQSDLAHLRDLESRGDFYAAAGNVLVPAGIIVGGLATYLFLRDRRTATTTAQLAPAILPHGAGLVLSFGATP